VAHDRRSPASAGRPRGWPRPLRSLRLHDEFNSLVHEQDLQRGRSRLLAKRRKSKPASLRQLRPSKMLPRSERGSRCGRACLLRAPCQARRPTPGAHSSGGGVADAARRAFLDLDSSRSTWKARLPRVLALLRGMAGGRHGRTAPRARGARSGAGASKPRDRRAPTGAATSRSASAPLRYRGML
jgi:hypothetical protein